ncbi:hypothetical protein BOTBODRAFT_628950 [Botryobasidium botryosum FD-172 SS1]|uniref:NACHT domain-containing protein n=1 Tax=Botryobasidium botryosum (strain FD-172 SS1) TaxID=930990 RepID=A0A067MRJ1_BOTB1|nr:hypothetical protein BOTBODRAFT_628950 [Botryobasidium botryosum FD-172 SS1]
MLLVIELQYQKNPSRAISVKLLLDDKEIGTLPAIDKDKSLRWEYKNSFAIQASSRITIQLLKYHNIRKWRDLAGTVLFTGQEALQQCADPLVSHLGTANLPSRRGQLPLISSPIAIERDIPEKGWQLKVVFAQPSLPRDRAEEAREVMGQLERVSTVLGHLGEARSVVGGILSVVTAVSKVYGPAHTVMEGITAVYEYLEKEEQVHQSMSELIARMARMLRHVNVAKERAKLEPLQDAIRAILLLSDEVLNYARTFIRHGQPSRLWSLGDVREEVDSLMKRFEGAETDVVMSAGPREFESLVEQPIALVGKPTRTSLLVVVVDALDECGTKETCPPLLSQLVKLSKLAHWLKVIVTSRTLKHISDCLEDAQTNHGDYLKCLDLDAERPADDLLHVTRQLLGRLKPHGWPGESKMEELATHADGLFVWIKVACGFLTNTTSPEVRDGRLRDLLSGSSAGDPVGALRALYVRALRDSLPPGDDNHQEFCMVVGAIVAANIPLPEAALAALLERKSLHEIIGCLQSVLYVDSSKDNVVQVCHASFKDFLTDKEHCPPEFYIDQPQHHARLADACLRTMVNGLRFNICNLESSHLLNAQVPDLESRVKEAIPRELQYGCLYWAHHLTQAEKGSSNLKIVELLQQLLLEPSVLYWLEALSMMNQLDAATPALLQAGSWIQHTPSMSTVPNVSAHFLPANLAEHTTPLSICTVICTNAFKN